MIARKWFFPVSIAGALLTAGFLFGYHGLLPRPQVDVRFQMPVRETESYIPEASMQPGTELVFIYIGSSSCHWSNVPELPSMVRKMKRAVRDQSRESGRNFSAMGVARDVVAQRGLKHLDRFGPFDEVTAGRGWLNLGVLEYIYGDLPGPAATPQIVVLEREIGRAGLRSISRQRILERRVGLDEIEEWVNSGSSLGSLSQIGHS